MCQAIREVLWEEGQEGSDSAHQGADRAVVEEHTTLQQDQLKQDQDVAAKDSYRIRHEHPCQGQQGKACNVVSVFLKTCAIENRHSQFRDIKSQKEEEDEEEDKEKENDIQQLLLVERRKKETK